MKLKLLRTVGFWEKERSQFEHIFFPPLALGVLYAQLKRHGYDISQDDLSMRIHYDHFSNKINKKLNHHIFFQEDRIRKYIETGMDDEIEKEIIKIIEGVDVKQADVFLLSIPESLLNQSNILFAISFAKFLKKQQNPYIVLGGHSTSLMLLVENYKFELDKIVDYLVRQEGEESVLEVVDRIEDKRDLNSEGRVIIVDRSSKEIIAPDFSGLPFEKYNLSFAKTEDAYQDKTLKDFFASNTLIFPFQFIKGCPNKCAFCNSSAVGLRNFLKPEIVVDAISFLRDKLRPTGLLFLNDTFNISRGYAEKICDLLLEKEVRILWSDCVRANGIDEELVLKMKKAGCIRLILGLETASAGLLSRVNKDITLLQVEQVLELANKYGIWTGIEIICGLPFETEDDISATINFLNKNKAYIDRIYCNIFDLRDGSLMYMHPEKYNIENICILNLYATNDEDKFNQCNFVRFGFDERNGLKWEDKKKQMIHSYWRLIRETDAGSPHFHFLEEHLLFYLYSKYDNKAAIKKYYQEAEDCLWKYKADSLVKKV